MKFLTLNIFSGMPSLLSHGLEFSEQWPIAKFLPPLVAQQQCKINSQEWLKNIPQLKNLDVENPGGKLKKKRIRIKKSRKITKCPHKERKHYAKLMCNVCYHAKARGEKASQCEHKDSMMYAKGMCLKCYQQNYKNKKKEVVNMTINDR